MKGTIFDIQRFSVHDGPGIRTTVFMKGCPLRCLWCHNPEGLSAKPQLSFYKNKCIGCGRCGKREKLSDAEKCPAGALCVCGRETDEDELFSDIIRDSIFYGTDGGVTFSGGECLLQADFVAAMLKRVKSRNITTAIDTSGCVPWESIQKTLEWCDLYLYDIKCANSAIHKKYTGKDNAIILSNLKKISDSGKRLWIRTPVIPGFNDNNEEITSVADIISTLQSVEQATLMPYHSFGADKYAALGMNYEFDITKKVSPEAMKSFENIFKSRKIKLA